MNLIEAIGNTPLVEVGFNCLPAVFAKLEYLNPGGSIKDRSARYMVEQAEKKGLLKPGGTIIDASSGNQGIAVAMIGAAKGYNVIISVCEKISQEKLETLKAYGAKVIVCPATMFIDDPESYHSRAVKIQKETPNSFMPNQYFNPLNRESHELGIGPEIWKETKGKVTHFFAGAGTGGTVSGVGRFLKKQNTNIKVIAIDSINSFKSTNGNPKPYKIEGVGIDFDSPVLDYSAIDEVIPVSDEDAFKMLKILARQHGFLAGLSSGAVAHVTYEYLKNISDKNAVAVMIFGDSGRAYLTKGVY